MSTIPRRGILQSPFSARVSPKLTAFASHSVLIDDRESLRKAWEDKGGIFVHHTSTRRTLELLRKKGILPEVVLDKEANCSDSKDDTLSATPEDQKSTTQVSSESKEKMKCSGSEQITCK